MHFNEYVEDPLGVKYIGEALPKRLESNRLYTIGDFSMYYHRNKWYVHLTGSVAGYEAESRAHAEAFAESFSNSVTASSRTNLPRTFSDLYEPQENVATLFGLLQASGSVVNISEARFNELLGGETENIHSRGYPVLFEGTEVAEKYTFKAFLRGGCSEVNESDDNPVPAWLVSYQTGTITHPLTGELVPVESRAPSDDCRNIYGKDVPIKSNDPILKNFVWVRDLQTYISVYDTNYKLVRTAESKSYQLGHAQSNSVFKMCEYLNAYTNEPKILFDDTVASAKYVDTHCFTCADCGKIFPNERLVARQLCKDCYVPRFRDMIHDYSANPLSKLGYLAEDGSIRHADEPMGKMRYFGIELELDTEDRTGAARSLLQLKEEKLGIASSDSSLRGDNPFEFKTVPIASPMLRRTVDRIFEIMSDTFTTNTSCGVHIHVSRSSLTEAQIARAFTFVHNSFNRTFLEDIAGRPSKSEYCKYDMARSDAQRLRKDYRKKNIAGKYYDIPKHRILNSGRHQALNTHKEVTLEFRLFAGTADKKVLMRYLEFVQALLSFTAPCSGNKLMTKQEFLRGINRKEYPVLHEFLVEKEYLKKPKQAPIVQTA